MKTRKQILGQLVFAVIAILFVYAPAQAQNDGDIVDRLNKTLGVRLPAEFEAKVKEFAANDRIMRTKSATAFTEQFIIEQFKNDWGIDRQNQLLFMWNSIYGGITEKFLYDFLEDDNEARSDEYFDQLKNITQFHESYKKGFIDYMDAGIAEADRRIAESDRRIAEADRRIAESDRRIAESDRRIAKADRRIAEAKRISEENLRKGLNGAIEIYYYNQIDPTYWNQKSQKEREDLNSNVNVLIQKCQELNIDYKAILRKELGNEKEAQELLKFYSVK